MDDVDGWWWPLAKNQPEASLRAVSQLYIPKYFAGIWCIITLSAKITKTKVESSSSSFILILFYFDSFFQLQWQCLLNCSCNSPQYIALLSRYLGCSLCSSLTSMTLIFVFHILFFSAPALFSITPKVLWSWLHCLQFQGYERSQSMICYHEMFGCKCLLRKYFITDLCSIMNISAAFVGTSQSSF